MFELPSRTISLLVVACLVLCFGLTGRLEPVFQSQRWSRTASPDIIVTVLGDSRRLFANQFYVKADEYYHSGFYPSIFDNRTAFETAHMAEDTGAVGSKNHGDEESFLGQPRNWIDAFGRHFYPSRHTHLDEGGPSGDLSGSEKVREILPWLKLATELDPDNVNTYTVTAYWLRVRMHRVDDAEQVLREGLRHNPKSYEILFELGRLDYESHHDVARARNVWELAVNYWVHQPAEGQSANHLIYEQITTHLADLEADQGNYKQAVIWLQIAQSVSQTPQDLQKRIDDLNRKIAIQPAGRLP